MIIGCSNWYLLEDVWYEYVRTVFAVLVPVLSVLLLAFCVVSGGSVDEDNEEEDWEEPREDGVEAAGEGPDEGLCPVGGVVDLSGPGIPPVDEQVGAVFGDHVFWVMEVLVCEVRECLSDRLVASHVFSEGVLLGVGGVEDVVCEAQNCVQGQAVGPGPIVFGRVVVVQVQRTVAVSVRDTCDVPEDQHETELLVGHVPRWNNQFLTLGTGVSV